MCAIFQKKGKKMLEKSRKGQNVWKFGQKCTKFGILKKVRWLHAIFTCNKQLEKVMVAQKVVAINILNSLFDIVKL